MNTDNWSNTLIYSFIHRSFGSRKKHKSNLTNKIKWMNEKLQWPCKLFSAHWHNHEQLRNKQQIAIYTGLHDLVYDSTLICTFRQDNSQYKRILSHIIRIDTFKSICTRLQSHLLHTNLSKSKAVKIMWSGHETIERHRQHEYTLLKSLTVGITWQFNVTVH